MATEKQQAAPIDIHVNKDTQQILLSFGGRTLNPDAYMDWRLAGQCLAMREPSRRITNHFQLWVDWSRQAECTQPDVPAMVTIWETMQPTRVRPISVTSPDPRESVQLKMKRLDEAAIMPTFGTDGAACFDIYAICEFGDAEAYINSTEHPNVTVETGWAFEVPEGWVMKVYSRSGQGFKDNTRLANCVGIIDSDYRGPLRVKLTRDDGETLFIRHGDRVAQAMLVRVPAVEFVEVEKLSSTDRGEQGYGSTGR